jgi:hypothetical protein
MKRLVLLAIFALSVLAGSTTPTKEGPVPMCNPCQWDSAGN